MFNIKKLNLGTAAALLVLGGVTGGLIGNAATGVVAFDATERAIGGYGQLVMDPSSTKQQLVEAWPAVPSAFQAMKDAAKGVGQSVQPKKQ